MDDIDFLSHKSIGEDHKKEEKKKSEEEIEWSKPSQETSNGNKKEPIPFLSFFRKRNKPMEEKNFKINDKDKLKESRKELLKLIKQKEGKKEESFKAIMKEQPSINKFETKQIVKTGNDDLSRRKGKSNFFSWLNHKIDPLNLGEKIKKKNQKKILVDYQQVFKDEKEKRGIFKPKLEVENKIIQKPIQKKEEPKLEKPKVKKEEQLSWLEKLSSKWQAVISKLKVKEEKKEIIFVPPIISKPSDILDENTKDKAEDKVKDTKDEKLIKRKEAKLKGDEGKQEDINILKTNLIKGEIVTFFDWRKKLVILIDAIIFSCITIGFIYGGIIIFQQRKEIRSRDFINNFNELQTQISQTEKDISQILVFKKKLEIIEAALAGHIYWTNFFKFLEDNTLADIFYFDFIGDTGGKYTLSAFAKDYNTISQQVKAMEKSNKVIEVKAYGGEITEQEKDTPYGVKFNLELSVTPKIFIE